MSPPARPDCNVRRARASREGLLARDREVPDRFAKNTQRTKPRFGRSWKETSSFIKRATATKAVSYRRDSFRSLQ